MLPSDRQARRRGGHRLRRHRRQGPAPDGATAGYAPTEDIRFIWTFELKVLGSNGWMRSDIEELLKLVQSGKLKVLVDKVYPLSEAREALRVIEDREVFGKVVVSP